MRKPYYHEIMLHHKCPNTYLNQRTRLITTDIKERNRHSSTSGTRITHYITQYISVTIYYLLLYIISCHTSIYLNIDVIRCVDCVDRAP